MKKFLGSVLLLLFIAINWVSAQCVGFTSPEPTCTEVLLNGDVVVYINSDPPAMGGPTVGQIDAFELYSTTNPLSWPTTPTVTVPVTGPNFPSSITHTGANGQTVDLWYRVKSICTGPPQTPLNESSIIRTVRLNHSVTNDFNVNLTWNWDSISANLNPVTINRKNPFNVATWSGIANPTFVAGTMTYTDTVVTCRDTVLYRIVMNNNSVPQACQTISSIATVLVEDKTPPNVPIIDTVSFDPVTNKPLITWNVNGKTDTKGYVVLFHPSGNCGTSRVVDSTYSRNDTKVIDKLWYDGINSGQYAVYAYDGCAPSGTFSISQKSLCANSIQLSTSLDVCQKSVNLSWTPYNDFATGTNVLYKIFVSINGSAFQYIDQTNSTVYLHEDPIENQLLTYKIVAFENGGAGPKTTSSNRVVVDAEFLRLPRNNYLRYATVEDENDVRLELFTDTKNDVGTYVLKRSLDTSDVYNTVNVFYAPEPKVPSDSITYLSDLSPITDRHQYFYRVDMFDTCGSYMKSSNLASTMLLKIQVDNVRRVNRLEWTNIIGWQGGTFAYKIYRFLDGAPLKDPLTKFPDSAVTTVFYDSLLLINDNITKGNPSQGEYCYYIEAIENEPTFKGLSPALSYSNEVCVIQQPYISSANAFTPNGDGKNETYRPVLIYHDFSSYSFYVMNRYGEIIYQTNNPKASWDGTYDGQPAPTGVYVYSVKYRSSSGENFEDKGSLTLIR